MSKKQIVEVLVEGGKATPAPPLGPSLSALKINVGKVVDEINKKTSEFKGMKVPVKVVVDPVSKDFSLNIGSPPTSELIKKEISLEKGSSEPDKNKVANLAMEQIIKIAKMKYDAMLINDLKAGIKSVIGSANSMGILVEGLNSKEINKEIDSGYYDAVIKKEITEVNEEKKTRLQEQLIQVQERLKKEIEKAKALEEELKGKKEEKPTEAAPTEEVKATEGEKKEVKETKTEVKEEKPKKETKK